MEKKEEIFSFDGIQKESLVDRLRQLIARKRSARAAAREWGLSFSTLNNYLNRGTEPPFSFAIKLAELEGVSLEWLAHGESMNSNATQSTRSDLEVSHSEVAPDALTREWLRIYERMTIPEREVVLNNIARNGINSLLHGSKEVASDQPWASDEERELLQRLMLEYGVDRKRIATILTLFSLPEQKAREILQRHTGAEHDGSPEREQHNKPLKRAKAS
jgi:transcriptional regulator with XRE-family HTH domain